MSDSGSVDESAGTDTRQEATDRLLEALAEATRQLAAGRWEQTAATTLELLARATRAEHAALVELRRDEGGSLVANTQVEWPADDGDRAGHGYPGVAAAAWGCDPPRPTPTSLAPAELGAPLAERATRRGTARVEIVPVLSQDRAWGFLAFEHATPATPPRLIEQEDRTRQAFAALLGSAIGRQEERRKRWADETRLRQIVEASSDCLIRFDTEQRALWASRGLRRLLGYAEPDIGSLTVERLVASRHRSTVVEALRSLFAERRVEPPAACEVVASDGTVVPVDLGWWPLGSSEHLDGFLAVLVDRRGSGERQTRDPDAEMMEAIGRRARGAADDFDNLLTVIHGFTELVRADLPISHPRQAELREIASATQRAAHLTRQLLAPSQPIEPVEPTRPLCPSDGPEGVTDGRHHAVLVVDDEPALRQLVRRILERDGYRVETAEDGEAALRLLGDAGRPFHMLLTDVVMPGLSGTELARRAVAIRPALRVLYMSGYSRSFDGSISARDLVDHPLIAKPFRPAELLTRVRSLF